MALLVLCAEVQSGAVRVRFEGDAAEPTRIARALNSALQRLPAFARSDVEVRARVTTSMNEFTSLTGLPATAAAAVVEDELVFPPARVTARLDDLDAVARHEVAHLLVLSRCRTAPRWFHEGLSDALAGTPLERSQATPECADAGSVSVDRLLLATSPTLREAGYRRARQAVDSILRSAGGLEQLWLALPTQCARGLDALSLDGGSVRALYREAARCPSSQR